MNVPDMFNVKDTKVVIPDSEMSAIILLRQLEFITNPLNDNYVVLEITLTTDLYRHLTLPGPLNQINLYPSPQVLRLMV